MAEQNLTKWEKMLHMQCLMSQFLLYQMKWAIWKVNCSLSSYTFRYINICTPEWVAWQMPASIARVRRSVRGNGGCFDLRVGVFVCLTPMSLDVLSGWVPKTVSSLSGLREWPWVGPENSLGGIWGTLPEDLCAPINSELWPCEPVPWRSRVCVFMGVGKVWNKRWVPCELRESAASSHDRYIKIKEKFPLHNVKLTDELLFKVMFL